jgi:hypothetical protein
MAARKRTPQSKSPHTNRSRSQRTPKPDSGSDSDKPKLDKIERGLKAVGKEWRKIVSIVRGDARKEKRKGHPMIAALYEAIADRLDPHQAISENFLQRLEEVTTLADWIPRSSALRHESQKLTKAKLTIAAQVQGWDDATKLSVLALLTRHGRPATARGATVEAWELRHLKGMSWANIERQVLSGWNYANPGDTIRREVALLEATFVSLGIELPNIKRS